MDFPLIISTAVILFFIYIAASSVESKIDSVKATLERLEHKVSRTDSTVLGIEEKINGTMQADDYAA